MISWWRNENLLWEDDSTWSPRRAARDLLSATAALGTFRSSVTLWRGLHDHTYRLTPSGLRDVDEPDVHLDEDDLVEKRVLSLLDEAEQARRRWPEAMALRGSDPLEMLALLQHMGADTPLLDLTADPLVALYFATEQNAVGNHGLLVAFQVGSWTRLPVRPGHWDSSWKDQISSLKRRSRDARIAFFEPPNITGRAAVQRSRLAFSPLPSVSAWSRAIGLLEIAEPPPGWTRERLELIFSGNPGRGRPSIPGVIAFRVRAGLKPYLRTLLDRTYGISASTLFPDTGGFVDWRLKRELRPAQ